MKGAIFCNGFYYGGEKGDPGIGISEIIQDENLGIHIFLTDGSEHIFPFNTKIPIPTQEDTGKFIRVNDEGKYVLDDSVKELPETTEDDAGKILAVGPDGEWVLADDSTGSVLPAVSSSDAGKILMVDQNGRWTVGEIENGNEVGY